MTLKKYAESRGCDLSLAMVAKLNGIRRNLLYQVWERNERHRIDEWIDVARKKIESVL